MKTQKMLDAVKSMFLKALTCEHFHRSTKRYEVADLCSFSSLHDVVQ